MNNLDKQYTDLLQDILDNGQTKSDRTGTGTISVFGRQIRHNMKDGFPLLTTKKMSFKTIVTELLWFLRGDTNIKYLVDNNCHIWDGDAYKNYQLLMIGNEPSKILSMTDFIDKIKNDEKFAKHWGELGPIYGRQWRNWNAIFDGGVDQIQNLINDLKTNPDSRRLMVNAWNVGELDQMVLPPCHYGFQVYTRELSFVERVVWVKNNSSTQQITLPQYIDDKFSLDEYFKPYGAPTRAISLMWNQRSVDTFLGLPFNIASYGLLLTMIADEVNMIPDELIGNLGDTHIYLNHIEQAKEQIGRDLTDEERYHIWFDNNYETGMERFFESNNLPNFDDGYYIPTPKRTKEPYPLPKVSVRDGIFCSSINDVILETYKSHPPIKAPLSN
jgi:thymidylate synthase